MKCIQEHVKRAVESLIERGEGEESMDAFLARLHRERANEHLVLPLFLFFIGTNVLNMLGSWK